MADERMEGEQSQVPAPHPPVADNVGALMEELTALRTWRLEQEAKERQRSEENRLAQHKQLAEKGQIEELVRRHSEEIASERKKADEAVARSKKRERDRELALALAGHPLMKGAAEQLTRLWAEEFDVVEAPDGYQVRSKDLKSPSDWVRERLAQEEYAHFVRAEHRGGGGSEHGATRNPTQAQAEEVKRNHLGHVILTPEHFLSRMSSGGSGNYSDGMGLKPVRN